MTFPSRYAMATIRTHYDNLKVAQDAPPEVIKAAYKSLAQRYHPDRNQGDKEAERIMQLINASYDVLSNPEKKAEHDAWIAEQTRPVTPARTPSHNSASPMGAHPFGNQHSTQRTAPPPPPFLVKILAQHLLRFRPIYMLLIVGYIVWNTISGVLYSIQLPREGMNGADGSKPIEYKLNESNPHHPAYLNANPGSHPGYQNPSLPGTAAQQRPMSPLAALLTQMENSAAIHNIIIEIQRARRRGMNDDLIYIQLIFSSRWSRFFEQWKKQGITDTMTAQRLGLKLSIPGEELREHAQRIEPNFFDQPQPDTATSLDAALGLLNPPKNLPVLPQETQIENINEKNMPRSTLLRHILTAGGRLPIAIRQKLALFRSQGVTDRQIYKSLGENSPFSATIQEARRRGFSDAEIAQVFGLNLPFEGEIR